MVHVVMWDWNTFWFYKRILPIDIFAKNSHVSVAVAYTGFFAWWKMENPVCPTQCGFMPSTDAFDFGKKSVDDWMNGKQKKKHQIHTINRSIQCVWVCCWATERQIRLFSIRTPCVHVPFCITHDMVFPRFTPLPQREASSKDTYFGEEFSTDGTFSFWCTIELLRLFRLFGKF